MSRKVRRQKFQIGDRVRIVKTLEPAMSHFPCNQNATVAYTYGQRYPSDDHEHYCLKLRRLGYVSWYSEDQLTLVKRNNAPKRTAVRLLCSE